MKLSKAQEKVLEEAKAKIDKARGCETYEEYFLKYEAKHKNYLYNTPEKYKARDPKGWERMKEWWNKYRNGIVLIHCNSKTIKKLEQFGLIEIKYDSTGENYGIDEVKIINY